MAQSIGGAIAEGLESGLRIGTGLMDRRRAQERQDEQDRLAREDRQRNIERQDAEDTRRKRAEGLAALGSQVESLRAEGQRFTPNDTSPAARAWAQRFESVKGAHNRALVEAGGYDFEADEREAAADLKALNAGQGASLPAARRVRAIVAATGRPIGDFLRADGKPSKIGGGIDDFANGLASGDQLMMMAGANTVLAPDLQRGIGQASPYGGTIVAKRVVGFDPAPGSTAENPRFIPRLQVYVKDGKARSAADVKKIEQLRAQDPNAPADATGYYFAPVTEDRSSNPDAKVKLLDLQSSMKYLDNLRQLEELLNDPAVAAEVAQGAGEWDQERFLRARAAAGLSATGKLTQTKLGAGDEIVTTDEKGREVGRIKSSMPKTNPEMEQARLNLISAQTTAAAALANLRDRRGDPNDLRERQFEARQALAQLVAQRVAASGMVRDYVAEMKDASSARRKELQPLLDAARADVTAIAEQIEQLNKALTTEGAPAPGLATGGKPGAAPTTAAGGKPAPGAAPAKPTVSNW